jgi:hypothetical protein
MKNTKCCVQKSTIRNKERQREVESKRKARQCEEIRQKECVEKRLSSQNIVRFFWMFKSGFMVGCFGFLRVD